MTTPLLGLALSGLALMLLTGCSSVVTLKHPQTGAVAKCGPYFYGAAYAEAVALREATCVKDFQRQGFERVPE